MRPFGLLFAISSFSLLITAWPAFAEDKPLPEAAQRLKQSYEGALKRAAAPLQAQYDALLNRLLQRSTQAGNLDEVLALKAELAHNPQTPADQAKLPAEARQASAQLQKSTETAVEPIRRIYVAELNKLVVESTRANRLDDAMAIRDEIKSVPVSSIAPAAAASFGSDSNGPGHFVVTNSTKAKEAEAVLAEAEGFSPDAYRSVKNLELVDFHDFAEEPMKHKNGKAEYVPGEHAKMGWVASAKGMVISGPYDKLEPGDYLVVYRLRFFDKSAPTDELAFVDVAQDGVTRSGQRPKGADAPPGVWHDFTLPLKVSEAKPYEFRLWGSGEKMAMDRVYIFKVKGS
ncbi:MAG TPA: hypothetical protein VGH90_02850 [Chthoniobacteraceae bacterium]|jgi:hypothetical protein